MRLRGYRIDLGYTLAALALGALLVLSFGHPGRAAEVALPDKLSPVAMNGKATYDAKCASCHGADGAGTDDKGPPLIHRIYEPGHHGDASFHRAVREGAQAHHWDFGDMKPVEDVSDAQIKWIVRYVREVQAANGIY